MADFTKVGRGRRSFLKLSGVFAINALAAFVLPVEKADAFLFSKKEYKVSKTRLAMGTFVAMTAIHPSRDQAEDAFGRAFDEINRLSGLLSRHSADSPVSILNTAGFLEEAPDELIYVVERSLYYNGETGGCFDISVKPLLDLYHKTSKSGISPHDSQIQEVLGWIGSRHISVEGRKLRFARENMGITLDGIAKGYIVDRAADILQKNGINNYLINAGGDIRTSGTAARGKKWTVAIQDPNKEGAYPDIITMSSGAIATSGNYEVFYDREKVFHHIITPSTGLSPQASASVSVAAPTVMDADALATAVFVLEPEPGVTYINTRPDCECLVIDRRGNEHSSSGWGL